MTYRTQALMAQDRELRDRVAACAAREGDRDPMSWASRNLWALSATPGWDDAYASALAAEPPTTAPGADEGVITDAMILPAVQALRDGQSEGTS